MELQLLQKQGETYDKVNHELTILQESLKAINDFDGKWWIWRDEWMIGDQWKYLTTYEKEY